MRAMTEDERKTYEKMKALREQCGSEDEFIKETAIAIAFLHEQIGILQSAVRRVEIDKLQTEVLGVEMEKLKQKIDNVHGSGLYELAFR